jgi:fumarylacetoacetase
VTLAYGVIRPPAGKPRVCARVAAGVVDLSGLGPEFRRPSLNAFMALGPDAWQEAHQRVRLLDGPAVDGELLLPFAVADYVDFYSSLEHATNLGRLLRPDAEALLPNWRWLPVGYHGRAGTVVASGTPIRRPHGQRRPPGAERPDFGPSGRLDFELEIGFVVGTASRLGEPVPVGEALAHVFGLVLVNDWSARDLQAWEYQPLGPFLGKSFATSISAWVVPLEELEPFRVRLPPQQPPPLDYMRAEPWAYDLPLEIELNGTIVSRTSARHLYWSLEQQVAHLTVSGARLRTGDLLASGTISGPERESRGSLIELAWNGAEPLQLPDGSTRGFLEDGDEVVLRAPPLELEVRGRIKP